MEWPSGPRGQRVTGTRLTTMPRHALGNPDTRHALFPQPAARGAFPHGQSTFASSNFTFFAGHSPASIRGNASRLVWDRPSFDSVDDFSFKKKKKTHKNAHCITLVIKYNFSVDNLTMTAERRSEVAFWGCMRVIRVSGQWWSVAGGGLACPPRLAAFPPGPLCLSGRSHSTRHDLTSMLRSSFLKSELLGSRKTDSEKPHRLLALTIISLCSYIKKNIYCFITNNHREATSVETEPVYESPGSRACS